MLSMHGYRFNPFSLIFFASSVIIITLIALLRKKKDTTTSAFWFLWVLTIGLEVATTQGIIINTNSQSTFSFWNYFNTLGVTLLPPVIMNFVMNFIEKGTMLRKHWYLLINFLPALLLLFLIWNTKRVLNFDIQQATESPWGFIPQATALGRTFLTIYNLAYCIIATSGLVFFYRKLADTEKKQSTRLIILANSISIIGSLLFSVLLPHILYLPIFPIEDLIAIVTISIITYSLITYRASLFTPFTLSQVVFRNMKEGVIAINQSYNIEFTNNGTEKLLQYDKKQLAQQSLKKIFESPQEYSRIIQELILPLNNHTTTQIEEARVTTISGKIITVTLSATKIVNEDQNVSGYILILTNIEKLKKYSEKLELTIKEIEQKNKTLEELRFELEKEKQKIEQRVHDRTRDIHAEHAKLQASINNLQLGFIMTDKENGILMTNNAVKNMFPSLYLQDSMTLQDIQSHILDTIDLKNSIQEALTKKNTISHNELHIDNKYINIFISPILISTDHNNEAIGTVIILEDETETKIIQRSKEEFFTIASHELRTPLTEIKGYLALLNEFYLNEINNADVQKMIKDIDISSTRLIDIVNDFLDTSRIEQGKINIKNEPCDLLPVIKAAMKETEAIAIQKKLFLNLENTLDTIKVYGDKERLKQIIVNLLSNALKYTKQGGVTITTDSPKNNTFKIQIRDTGQGISEHTKELLFHKIQQGSHEDSHLKEAGSGLGLYISKLLMEKMNGSIELEKTEIGKGSIFSFTIPMIAN